jgi:hypothetical protein
VRRGSHSPNGGGVDLAALDDLDEDGLEEVLVESVLEATLLGLDVSGFTWKNAGCGTYLGERGANSRDDDDVIGRVHEEAGLAEGGESVGDGLEGRHCGFVVSCE